MVITSWAAEQRVRLEPPPAADRPDRDWVGVTILVVFLLGMGLITVTWQGAVLLGTIGVLGGFMQVSIFTWLQRRTPPALMGRVMSMFMFIFLGLAPLSGAVTGWMLRSITLMQLFVGTGGLLACIALLALVASPVRQVTDGPVPQTL